MIFVSSTQALRVRLLVRSLHVVNVSFFRDDQAFSIGAKGYRPTPPTAENCVRQTARDIRQLGEMLVIDSLWGIFHD